MARTQTPDLFEGPGVSTCWLWSGAVNGCGYGVVNVGDLHPSPKRYVYVHRAVFEHFNGPIPRDVMVMHLCNVRRCCNPVHLKLGTMSENIKYAYDTGTRHGFARPK